ncbi:hypothetical protein MKEN_00969900 [Mycena kentingensis (nom. inval.)]|nr:hypothetical protein MKEN_00969900 [Mycena kentingensis (nom. inval.)]
MSSRMLCTCWRYCQGGKRVSRTTYREHAPICAAEEQAAAQMRGPQVASGSGGGPAGRSDSESSSGDDEDSDSSSAASERLERRRKRPLSPVNEAWPAATQREDNNDIDMESGHDPPSPHDPPPQHGPDTRHQDEPQVQDEPELQEQEPPEQHNSQSEEDLDRGDGVHPEILSSRLEDLQLGLDYIELVKSATLDNDDLPEDIKAALRDAPEGLPSIDDPDLRHSLDVFLALKDCSEETYELPYYAQWAMERTIGNLVEELRLPSNPFAHLAQRALLRAQVNALLAMFPELDTTSEKESKIPRGALQLRGKLVLLGTKDSTNYSPPEDEAAAVRAHFGKGQNTAVRFARWARMRLPNGQIVRSTWREKIKVGPIRISSNVKAMFEGKTVIAQIQYFFLAGEREALAVAALYEPPKRELLEKSYGTLWVSRGIQRMVVLRDVDILTVVAMVPHTVDGEDAFYLVEKPGLDVSRMGGFNDPEEINEGEENT